MIHPKEHFFRGVDGRTLDRVSGLRAHYPSYFFAWKLSLFSPRLKGIELNLHETVPDDFLIKDMMFLLCVTSSQSYNI